MTRKIPPNYIWKQDSSEKFQTALNSIPIQHKIEIFQKKINDRALDKDINTTVCEFNDIILEAANLSLKKPNTRLKKRKNKRWFDTDLKKLRENVISQGRLYSKFPKDPYVKGHYYKLYRQYNKLRKLKYRQFQDKVIKQLDD